MEYTIARMRSDQSRHGSRLADYGDSWFRAVNSSSPPSGLGLEDPRRRLLYAKLQTHDRLTTVVRARDLGLIRDEDLSTEFGWNIRRDLRYRGAMAGEGA